MSEALAAAYQPLPVRTIIPLARAKRRSRSRTLATFAILFVLTAVIVLYLRFTDPAASKRWRKTI